MSSHIGIQLHDTCGSIRLTQKHLFQIITATREPNNVLSLPGFTRGPGGKSSYALGPPLLGMYLGVKIIEDVFNNFMLIISYPEYIIRNIFSLQNILME